ncbi:hypothetical protein, partial [Stieleria sp.]|uniref:hypothetical protein n=1 Tax=Stieleria sp. TaxID=2795976 RepID=UPI00356417F1
MAFPTGWTRKCELTFASTPTADLAALFTEDNLPSEMFDADGDNPALNGGGDIRFSSDSAGTSQLPCEVVSFVTDNDPANGTAQVWVKVPAAASVWVWYGKT